MSDEFTSEIPQGTAPGDSVSNQPHDESFGESPTPEAEFTLEDLFEQGINEDQVKQGEKDMLLPVGTYTTVPPFAVKLGKDKAHPARKVVQFWGGVELGDVIGKSGFRFSPERFNAIDRDTQEVTDKPDRLYKNYVLAVKAYKVAYKAEPSSLGDVIQYIRDYSVRLRIIQTSDGENMVVSISAIRPEA